MWDRIELSGLIVVDWALGSHMRLFIAVLLPESVRREVVLLRHSMTGVVGKWVEPENLHINILFIGEVSAEHLAPLTHRLEACVNGFAPFSLQLKDLVVITPKLPRVLALEVLTQPEFRLLQQALRKCVLAFSAEPSFKPAHLTLARLKRPLLTRSTQPRLTRSAQFNVSELTLFKSDLRPTGPIYTPLRALKLGFKLKPGPFRANVAMCILNPKHEVLVVRHPDHSVDAWQLPQGGVADGDSIVQTIKRELKEELGLERYTLLRVSEQVYRYRWPLRLIRQGKDQSKKGFVGQEQRLVVVFVDQARPHLVPEPREIKSFKWVPRLSLVQTLHPTRRRLGRLVMVELRKLGI